MSLPSLNPLQQASLAIADAANNLLATQSAWYERIYSSPPEIVLGWLNAEPLVWAQRLASNSAMATAGNANLALNDDADNPQFPARAQTEMPPGYAFDQGTGQFTYTAPPEPTAPEVDDTPTPMP